MKKLFQLAAVSLAVLSCAAIAAPAQARGDEHRRVVVVEKGRGHAYGHVKREVIVVQQHRKIRHSYQRRLTDRTGVHFTFYW